MASIAAVLMVLALGIIITLIRRRDILHSQRAKESLQSEKQLLHTLMDNLPDVIYFKDRGEPIYPNQ